jgi:hypothetical protein
MIGKLFRLGYTVEVTWKLMRRHGLVVPGPGPAGDGTDERAPERGNAARRHRPIRHGTIRSQRPDQDTPKGLAPQAGRGGHQAGAVIRRHQREGEKEKQVRNRLRTTLAILAVSVAAALPVMSAAAPQASAGTARPSSARFSVVGTYNICVNGGGCWHTNGSGTQLTLSSLSNASNITVLVSNGYYKFQDGNGKCMYMGSGPSFPLMTGSNACSSTYGSSSTQVFTTPNEPGGFYIVSAYGGPGGTGRAMAFNGIDGKPIWVNVSSGYYTWNEIT